MKKIVFGFLAFSSSVIATAVIAAPKIPTAPAAQTMVQQAQKFGWPDRPGGPGPEPGPGWAAGSVCDSIQQMCAAQSTAGGQSYTACVASHGCL
ncbi:hypothetical protein [Hyphomicrobium sp.]|uniref:hypothetical protein n=1 Tax=Hyphomicrobium sp. TaxID=82 RepID=UPI001E0D92E8|nr:hypothetical protein [Hyphomicrobium sp.]MBY0558904.1 hypothetical protein [Hyphomicrobium sp.]